MNEVDVSIIGAGITGAGIAQACAARGWSTALFERQAKAGLATSSNSSKLIHGGLRYLESGQFGLVYECLRERHDLLKNAPDLVKLKPFYLPVYTDGSRSYWWIKAGLCLYSLLSGKRFKELSRQQYSRLPIAQHNLRAVFCYWDAQTHDRLLTQRVVRSAQKLGATFMSHSEVHAIQQNERGYRLELTNGEQWQTRVLINAAGPWVTEVADMCPQLPQLSIQWVQGIHILVDLPAADGCFYVEAPSDKRAVFILPWEGKTLIGTTETPIQNLADAGARDSEIDYLLAVANFYLPQQTLTHQHILQVMSGLRVLAAPENSEQGDSHAINRQSRDTQIFYSSVCPGYIAVYGGKLTSYRATAQKVAQLLSRYLPAKNSIDVRGLPLPPAPEEHKP